MITAALLQELGNDRLEPEIASLAAELGDATSPATSSPKSASSVANSL